MRSGEFFRAWTKSKMTVIQKKLKRLRKNVDSCDKKILQALARRLSVVHEIGLLKRGAGIPLKQVNRWQEIIVSRSALGKILGLRPILIKRLFKVIHHESLQIQRELPKKNERKRK